MKKLLIITTLTLLAATGCSHLDSLFRKDILMEQVIIEKDKIDRTENPAMQMLLRQELGKKIIVLDDITVKDVTVSNNIDYDFCAIADLTVDGKKVECFIYSKNVNTISKLEKNKSRIHVEGDFGRFFTTLDNYYTKIEIIEAKIKILEEKN
ncbi:MAG: hypothetical protein CVV44_18750 [Spirochaetae bacterium HGW-Spirochaetae-1]|jgi:hypothetical protein|nr:MAG: hypothetical protein CVV44_18750 [Spirochaetae bacterium HGW-Spirochaetae-1]